MNVIRFLAANWDSVFVVAVAVGAIIAVAAKKQWGLLEKILFALVTWAEREYGGGTGQLKLAAVIERLYPHIPAVMRIFITQGKLEQIVNDALAETKERWEKNPRLLERG